MDTKFKQILENYDSINETYINGIQPKDMFASHNRIKQIQSRMRQTRVKVPTLLDSPGINTKLNSVIPDFYDVIKTLWICWKYKGMEESDMDFEEIMDEAYNTFKKLRVDFEKKIQNTFGPVSNFDFFGSPIWSLWDKEATEYCGIDNEEPSSELAAFTFFELFKHTYNVDIENLGQNSFS